METRIHRRTVDAPVVFRNFGWPADAVGIRNRPGNYDKIDDPYEVFKPNWVFCFFGMNESFDGDDPATIAKFENQYAQLLDGQQALLDNDPKHFVLFSPIAFEPSGNPLQPSGEAENLHLRAYTEAVKRVAADRNLRFVDLFAPTLEMFNADSGAAVHDQRYSP